MKLILLSASVFRKIEARSALREIYKVRKRCTEICRYADVTELARYKAEVDIGGACRANSTHFSAPVSCHRYLEHSLPMKLESLLSSLRLLILTGVRTSECAPRRVQRLT